jgi:hypothetical protein
MPRQPTKAEISRIMSLMGKKGGQSGTGKAKARPSKVARKAALARWRKRDEHA